VGGVPTRVRTVLDVARPWLPSQRLWTGLVVVALLAALGALAGWRMGWFGGAPRPKDLLRQRLEAPPPTSPSPRPPARAIAPPQPTSPPAPEPTTPTPGPMTASPPPRPAERSAAVTPPVLTPPTAPPPAPSARPGAAPAVGARFALEIGPFMTAQEAERIERQLNEAGFQTARLRQQTGAALYAVLIERIPTAQAAQAFVAALREQGFNDAFVVGEREPMSVQVGLPLPLRGAVQTAERLRASGHQVRVAVQPGEAVTYSIRHGNFTTSAEAAAKGQELIRLGLAHQVVRVK
jgi:SPOR domain